MYKSICLQICLSQWIRYWATDPHIPISNPPVSFAKFIEINFRKSSFFSKIVYFLFSWHMYLLHTIVSFIIKWIRADLINSLKVKWATLKIYIYILFKKFQYQHFKIIQSLGGDPPSQLHACFSPCISTFYHLSILFYL